MSSAKALLKAAKAALDDQKFGEVVSKSQQVLKDDPHNFHANIFLGLALEKQNQSTASEQAYRAAINVKDGDVLGWQGLVSLYEKQSAVNLDKYHDAALRLAIIYMQHDERTKCQTTIDKYTLTAQKFGSRTQYKRSLELVLPGSSVFEYLEGRIPRPDYTYGILAGICELEEKEKVNSEIGQRRTRLGARIEQVTLEVQREVLSQSSLGQIYANIIDWTHDDDVRRLNEEKQLQHAHDTLAILPAAAKKAKRKEVQSLAQGLVILKHPFLLAWRIHIEWNDLPTVEAYDFTTLRSFMELFPEDGLAKVLKGYISSDIPPSDLKQTDLDNEPNDLVKTQDALILMVEGLQDAPQSMLAHRLVGSYYLYLDEFESAVGTLRAGLARVSSESKTNGMRLCEIEDAMNLTLATALIQYQAPRHHGAGRQIFEEILKRKPSDAAALVGIGMIYEEQEDYDEAISFLSRALAKNDDPKIQAEKAWCQALRGDYEDAQDCLESSLAGMEGSDAKSKFLRSQTLYRIGMCVWSLDPSRSARKDRQGAYAHFIASLQTDMNFAPSYTQLGIYYEDYGRDGKRATKCFHKAFELSVSEIGAARRLAHSFAKSGEWDLVEVISQRVIESGKLRPPPGSRKKAISWPFAALGVVQLNNQEYAKSLVSFQSAIRDSPGDYHCWVGLGESYHHSGRFIAATKAFEHAQTLGETAASDGMWFTQYMLANVKRELGEYEDASTRYEEVLRSKPGEFGVFLAFLQNLVESAWHNIELGFYGRAAKSALKAIEVAFQIIQIRADGFSLWKAIGDACSVFCIIPGYEDMLSRRMLDSLFGHGYDPAAHDLVTSIDGVGRDAIGEGKGSDAPLRPLSVSAALLAHKRAIAVSVSDVYAQAVAWYNLGWSEYIAHQMTRSDGKWSNSASGFLNASVQCFKRAIELESGNAEFWNSLAIVTCDLSPKVCQHAFVRSLYLNDRNPKVWANIGAYYLIQNDTDLAHEAFTRAQSLDPAYTQSWIGQGLLSESFLDTSRARQLFAQAFEISDSTSMMIKSVHARAVFDSAKSEQAQARDFLEPVLSLHQLQSQLPSDHASLRLAALFTERIGNFAEAEETLVIVCSRLEAEYEDKESSSTILRFAQTKADIARLQLAQASYEMAAENAGTALDLSESEDDNSLRKAIRLSAHVTAGSAYFYQDLINDAIEMFKRVLSENDDDPDIVCLLCQLLWAKGGQDNQEVARDQLLDCIENYPQHSGLTALLGCISIFEDDDQTADAVSSDLEAMRTQDRSLEERTKVSQLLLIMQELRQKHDGRSRSTVADAQALVMLSPSQSNNWSQLAADAGATVPAELAILTATKAAPPRGQLQAQDICWSYVGTGTPADAQKAIMFAPFDKNGWKSLLGGDA